MAANVMKRQQTLALQDEVKTLIEKQQALIAKLKDDDAVWKYESDVNALTRAELERQIEALSSDKVKVETLELTIAVIGTMKAGKSTTINALVGDEVLPHRLTAMTTLPTLIRHKPGQKNPILKLHNLDLLKKLVGKVKQKVDALDELDDDLSKINEALTTVRNMTVDIREEYVGKDEIHQALFLINDIFRLAGHPKFSVELDTYLKHFTEITSLPTVEVEFCCLNGKLQGANAGSLALLDTPGPNEAGQNVVLRHILSEQIEINASMVLLVMNYTQLNTEQDSEIRNQIKDIKEVFRDRSFVVVNRFDEKKQNDLNEAQTRKLASELLNDSVEDDFISPNAVFPVSSYYAFLAGRVRQQIKPEMELKNFLFDEKNQDFIRATFGLIDIEDDDTSQISFKDIEVKCDRLWKRSGYELFTQNMLEKAYTKAGENSLQAALARLKENAGKVDSFSTAVRGGLAQEMHGLKESIERTQELRQAIDAMHGKLDEVKGRSISEYQNKARVVLNKHIADVKSSIEDEFSKEHRFLLSKLEADFQEKSSYRYQSRTKKCEESALENDLKNIREEIEKHSNSGDGILDYRSNKQAALNFATKASNVTNALLSSMAQSLQEQLSLLEGRVQQEIQMELVDKLEAICRDYEEIMQEKGFSFEVQLVDSLALDLLDDTPRSVDAAEAIQSYQESVTLTGKKRVLRKGPWHQFLKAVSFGLRDDYDEELTPRTFQRQGYKIVLDDYIKEAQQRADSFAENFDIRLEKQLEEKLVPRVDQVFADVAAKVNRIKEALEQSKALKADGVAVTSAILETLDAIKNENVRQLKRLTVVSLGFEELIAGKQGGV